jgi:hypothetical protein
MTLADVPAVLAKLAEQNRRDGTSYAMPQVFDRGGVRLPRISLALVAVDVETGEVVQGHVWEQTVEHLAFGISSEATVCSMHEQEAVFHLLRQRGFRDEHILVPIERAGEMAHGLDKILGMTCTEKVLLHFYRLLDPAENDELRKWYKDKEAKSVESPAAGRVESGAGRESDL